MNVLIAATASIGAKDVPELVSMISEFADVKLILSKNAASFFEQDPRALGCETFDDQSEMYIWKERGDPILHIDLRNWADVLLVAPMTANTLSKFATGRCDDLISTVFRAWKLRDKPILVAPSMNLYMWEHPITAQHLEILASWGIEVIEPRSKLLAGGDHGPAALPLPRTLADAVAVTMRARGGGDDGPGRPEPRPPKVSGHR